MPGSSNTILVVDDEVAIVRVTTQLLEFEGYRVLTAGTGFDALRAAADPGVFMVLLDIGLPDLSGLEVLRRVRQMRPSLPVIMVTGNNEESEGRRAIGLGAWDYLAKPVDYALLKETLRRIAGGNSP